jgi:aspartyl-tRNA(Asn)/glutamyl-tRNA(Gln) amidotransferase subunit A
MSLGPRVPPASTALYGRTLCLLVSVLELLGIVGSWLAATFTKRLFSFDRLHARLRKLNDAATGDTLGISASAPLATSALDERPIRGRPAIWPICEDADKQLSYAQTWSFFQSYAAAMGMSAAKASETSDSSPSTAESGYRIRPGSCFFYHQRYRRRECTPLQMLEAALTAIENMEREGVSAWGPSPFSQLFVDRARRAAIASTQRYAAQPEPQPRSVLDGILVVVKDSLNVAGHVTSSGTRVKQPIRTYRDGPCLVDRDALLITRLEAAGAIILGKTKMTEFGLDPLGFSEVYAMPPCAFSNKHAAGGSSTGSAAAVGRVSILHVPVAYGTDGGGSVRIPAAWNGLFGFKPTHGFLLPRHGDPGIVHSSVAHGGILGVSVLDLVAFLVAAVQNEETDEAIKAIPWSQADDRGDGYAPRGSAKQAVAAALTRLQQIISLLADASPASRVKAKPLRIGFPVSEWERCTSIPIRQAGCEALDCLVRAGVAELVTVPPEVLSLQPFASALGAIYLPLDALESLLSTEWSDRRRSDLLEYGSRLVLLTVKGITGADMALARRARAVLRAQLATWFRQEKVDVLALPTTDTLPVPFQPDQRPSKDLRATWQAVTYTFVANIAGLPAGTAPVGWSTVSDAAEPANRVSLPIGMQFIADAYDDAAVLSALALVERFVPMPKLPKAPARRNG